MTTATKIVNDSLKLCNEFSGILPVDPKIQQQGFERLVDMLNTMRGDHLYVTPQIPAAIGDDLKEFSWAKKGLTYRLAEEVAPYIQVTGFVPTFPKMAKESWRTLYLNAKPSTNQSLPDTLPIGGGNEYWNSWVSRFYSENDNAKYEHYEIVHKGTNNLYIADFDPDASRNSTTVTSVVWSQLDSSTVTITNESLSSNTAQAFIAFPDTGIQKVKARATYADGAINDFNFQFQVTEL